MANQSILIQKFATHSVYKTGKILGQGSFSVVDKRILGGNYVAIKTIRRQSNILCQVNEINILSRLCHDNVVKMFGVLDDPDPDTKIVLEYLECGCLFEYVLKTEMTESDQLIILKGISKGMQYLHEMNVIHRDLASRNILLGSQLTAKISDFGFSVLTTVANFYAYFEYSKEELNRMPYRYLPPESVAGLLDTPGTKCVYSKSGDVWSYAAIIYEMMVPGKVPFHEFGTNNVVEIVRRICKGFYPMCCPTKSNSFMSNLSQAIFKCPRDQRPTFEEILKTIENRLECLSVNDFAISHQPISQAQKTEDGTNMTNVALGSVDSGIGSTSFSMDSTCDNDELDQLKNCSDIKAAVVLQNVTTVLPDMDFAEGIFKKFGRPNLKINAIKRLSSKSLAIVVKSRSSNTTMNPEMIKALSSMVNDIKACSSVYSSSIKVDLYNREEFNLDETG
ncbi:ephrin type-B receptor 1 [Folsomia candida]|nr:ephrin type-B receptor 1 [Folsomia candida]XP_021966755.1 ephrin type-B receptor 1 [Folsomia candida]XP_035700997.1 ephrin type-B receptor 1 [Folsomia candida]